jgi:hypothetical protein
MAVFYCLAYCLGTYWFYTLSIATYLKFYVCPKSNFSKFDRVSALDCKCNDLMGFGGYFSLLIPFELSVAD